jgi:hypothetical protein
MDRCWYCGSIDEPAYEWEHQIPLIRGWNGEPLVRSCRACNRLKGSRTVEEFRTLLADVAGEPVVFAGEAEPGQPYSDVSLLRSWVGKRASVELRTRTIERARAALRFEQRRGRVSLTLHELVDELVSEGLDRLAQKHNDGQPFPAIHRSVQMSLLQDPQPSTEPTEEMGPFLLVESGDA